MIKWTTPTLRCNLMTELDFDYIIFTLKSSTGKVEKRIEKSEVIVEDEKTYFDVTFTQEETGDIVGGKVEAQLNLMNGDTRIATNIIELNASRNLHNEVI